MNYQELISIPDSGLDAFRPKPTIPNDLFIELSCNIAEYVLKETFEGQITQTEDNGDVRFTDEAQDEFNDHLDMIQDMIERILEKTDV